MSVILAVHAVDSISSRIDRGEVFGFLGANGAGKTIRVYYLKPPAYFG